MRLVLLLSALLACGCTTPVQLMFPLGPEGERAVAESAKLVDQGKHQEAVAVLERGLENGILRKDELLYRLGVLLVSPEVADYDRARKVFWRLLADYPKSPRADAAKAMSGLLERMYALEEDLRKIVDIDVEAERQRREEPPPEAQQKGPG